MSTRKKLLIACLALMALTMTSCNNSDDNNDSTPQAREWKPGTIALESSEQTMAVNNNDFAFRLFSQCETANAGQSNLVSPLSMTYLMAMLSDGAKGQTRTEIIDMLGFKGYDDTAVRKFCQTVMSASQQMDGRIQLETANALFLQDGFPVKESYTSTISNYYRGDAQSLDFRNGSDAVGRINQWCSDHTHGLIPTFVKEVAPETKLMSLNAIYFKGQWYNQFDKSRTQDATFTREDQTKTSVKMMNQREDFDYTDNEAWQMVVLPYGNGSFRMAVMLPKEGKTVADIASGLTASTFAEALEKAKSHDVTLSLPRFSTSIELNCKDLLKAMGAATMFSMNADFRNISDATLYVSQVKQKATIEVNEEGTTAAAVTGDGMLTTDFNYGKRITFCADHPFLYVIYESSSKLIYFIGTYKG